jgi:hypothetical protein
MTCAYCGQPVTDSCLTFKGLVYHALRGLHDGRLIYVDRAATCFEQSDMGTKSLCGQTAPTIMDSARTPPANL